MNGSRDQEQNPTPASYADFDEQREGGALRTILQFVAIPLLIVGTAVGLFLGIGFLVGGGPKTTLDFVELLRSDTVNRRWHAAMELANRLHGPEVPAGFRDERVVLALSDALERERREEIDPPKGAIVILRILKRLRDPRTLDAVRRAAGDSHDWVRSHAVQALGALRDEASRPLLRRYTRHEDHGTRQAALTALVALDQPSGTRPGDPVLLEDETRAVAVEMLGDRHENVRFQAAVVLALAGEPRALRTLVRAADRDHLESLVPDEDFDTRLSGLSRFKVHSNLILVALEAMEALGIRDDPQAVAAVRALLDDGDPHVRQRARHLLTKWNLNN